MTDKSAGTKLTPAAREVLDEMTVELRQELIDRAERNAATPAGDVREVTVRDLLAAASELRRGGRAVEHTRQTDERWALVAIATGVAGIFAATASSLSLRPIWVLAITAAIPITAVLSAYLGAAMSRAKLEGKDFELAVGPMKIYRHSMTSDAGLDFLGAWIDFENLARQVALEWRGEAGATGTLRDLLRLLAEGNRLAPEDVELAHRLLQLRNAIAHQGPGELPDPDELSRALIELERLRDTLRSWLRNG